MKELLQQQIQRQVNADQQSRQLAAAMKTQQQRSNANSAEALQAIFFLLQVGLTLYSLGAFTPGSGPSSAFIPQPDPWFDPNFVGF